MSAIYDLHAHSRASDGELTPAELVKLAWQQGVDVLALTDHDTVTGLAEARAEARRLGIGFVPGIEISVTWERQTVHIVGLGIDAADRTLNQGLQALQEFREWRAEEIARRLVRDARVATDILDRARRLATGPIVSRTHFAHCLVAEGKAKDIRAVFKKFLVRGKPGYVPGQWATLEEALGWIRGAGGQAVIAHPARYNMTNTRLKRLIEDFKTAGGEALEVVSGSHGRDDIQYMARLANQQDLLASAGTDYHGPSNAWLALGRMPALPAECTPIWHDWTGKRAVSA
jgi:predicted metal-dependent phosphoesterase TrpH